MFINWAELVEWSDSGTILESYTLRKLMHDFEAYIQQERTGIAMARGLVSWNALLKNELKMDPQNIDMKKVLNWLEKDLTKNLEKLQFAGPSTSKVQIDPTFEKHALTILHVIMARYKHEVNIDMLTAFFANDAANIKDKEFQKFINEMGLEDIKENMRAVLKKHVDMFSVGAGASPKVVQIKDKNGKATGKKAFDNTRKTSGTGTKKTTKYSGLLRASDATKNIFVQCGVPDDDLTFENWRGYCELNKLDGKSATIKDLLEFKAQTEN